MMVSMLANDFSLWGEPRDAAVFLCSIFLLFPILDKFYTFSPISSIARSFCSAKYFLVTALLLTFSFSSLLSLLLFFILYSITSILRFSYRKLLLLFC